MDAAVESFVDNLQRSGLLSEEQLGEVRSKAEASDTPVALARGLIAQGLLTRWQAGQLIAGRTAGFVLGKYKLLELLGRGGMGNVYMAHHVAMNRRVALKLLSRSLDRDPEARERFFAEARTAAALDHPNIVRAYSIDTANERYFMVMEYVDGRDLQRVVEEDGPMAYEAAIDAVRQAADGLAHAHGRGLVHCDIKPANLLRNSQGLVKILDLGLARLGPDRDCRVTADDQELGTVDYLAPEQALGGTFDHRADIYALGCTLYFLLTGQPPFPEGTLAERIFKHQTEQPRSILELRPSTPKPLVRICRKMMAKDPAERFQSAAEVNRALDRLNVEPALRRAVAVDQPADAATSDSLPGSTASTVQIEALPAPVRITPLQALIVAGSVLAVIALAVVGAMTMIAVLKPKPVAPAPEPAVQSPVPAAAAAAPVVPEPAPVEKGAPRETAAASAAGGPQDDSPLDTVSESKPPEAAPAMPAQSASPADGKTAKPADDKTDKKEGSQMAKPGRKTNPNKPAGSAGKAKSKPMTPSKP